jgi:hypothetical protein
MDPYFFLNPEILKLFLEFSKISVIISGSPANAA